MKMYVEIEWNDEELGEKWMNIDNLRLLMYGQQYTKPELVAVKEINPLDFVFDRVLRGEVAIRQKQ